MTPQRSETGRWGCSSSNLTLPSGVKLASLKTSQVIKQTQLKENAFIVLKHFLNHIVYADMSFITKYLHIFDIFKLNFNISLVE